MNRKEFIRNGILGGAAMMALPGNIFSSTQERSGITKSATPFSMKFSPDFNVFNEGEGAILEEQLEWGYEQGFRAWESTWLRRKTVEEQQLIKRVMDRLGMEF